MITRLDTDSYTSDYLQTVPKAGKNYYIALEHDYSPRLNLSGISIFLYTESGNDTVFAGDTEKFAMWFSTNVENMDTTLSLTSNDQSVAKVIAEGTVTFPKQGTVTITGSALKRALVSSVTLNVQSFHELTLNAPKNLTPDGINTSAAMVSFTPDINADYVLTIHYQAGGSYWEYGFDLTERSGSEIEWLNNENIPNGSTMTLKQEAGKDAPILLTEPNVDTGVPEYIEANLVPGGKVYIPGGSAAVSENFENIPTVMGFDVQRLKGAGRYETNLAIPKKAGVTATAEVLIATGINYADSLSASATGLPMLLVGNTLTVTQKEFLATTSKDFVILVSTGAVSTEVEAELAAIGTVVRVNVTNRYGSEAGRWIPGHILEISLPPKSRPQTCLELERCNLLFFLPIVWLSCRPFDSSKDVNYCSRHLSCWPKSRKVQKILIW